jgi:hypothetical protein
LALAGPPVAAGPVRLGILVDDCLNFAWEFHFILCYIMIKILNLVQFFKYLKSFKYLKN